MQMFNKSGLDLGPLEDLIKEFFPFAQKRHGFQHPPKLFLLGDEENAANPLGKTGGYNPDSMEVTIYVSGRHPKDILRSLSHELVHHNQNERGDLSGAISTALGYAQEDPHMREMEREAYEKGNLCLRDWEDGRKKQLQESIYYETIIGGDEMSEKTPLKEWKDNEINTRLMEKFGLLKEAESGQADSITFVEDTTDEKKSGDEEPNEEEDEDEDISGLERNSTNETLSRLNEEVTHLLNEQSTLGHFWNWATQGYRKDPVQAAMERTGARTMSARPTGETRQKEVQYFTRENEAGGEDVLADPRAIFDDAGNLAPGVNVRYETKDVPVYQPAGESARREMGVVPRGTEAKSTEFSNPVSRAWYGMGDKGGWLDPSHAAWSATGFGEMIDPGGVYAHGPDHLINQMVSAGEHKQQATDELDRDLMLTADLLSTALPLGPTGYAKASRFNPNVRNIRQFGKRQPVKPPGMSQKRWERLLQQNPERAARSPFTKGDYSLKSRMQEPAIPRRISDYYDPRLDPAIQPVSRRAPRRLEDWGGGPPPLPNTSGGAFGVRSPGAVRIPAARTEPPPIPGTPGQLDDIINRHARPKRPVDGGPAVDETSQLLDDDWFSPKTEYADSVFKASDLVPQFRFRDRVRNFRNPFRARETDPSLIKLDIDGNIIENADIADFIVHPNELKKLFGKEHVAAIDANPQIYAMQLRNQLRNTGQWKMAQAAGDDMATHTPSFFRGDPLGTNPIGTRMGDRFLGTNRLTGELEYFPYRPPAKGFFGGEGARKAFTHGAPLAGAGAYAYLNPEEAALPWTPEEPFMTLDRPFAEPGTPLFPWDAGLGDPRLESPGYPTAEYNPLSSRVWDPDQIYLMTSPAGWQEARDSEGNLVARRRNGSAPWADPVTGEELTDEQADEIFTRSIPDLQFRGRPVLPDYPTLTPPPGWEPADPETTEKDLRGYLRERGITLNQYLQEIEAQRRALQDRAEQEVPRKRNDDLKEQAPYIWEDLYESLDQDENYYNTLFEGIKEIWTKNTKE